MKQLIIINMICCVLIVLGNFFNYFINFLIFNLRDYNNTNNGKFVGCAKSHYPCLSDDKLKKLPIQQICEKDSLLFF